MRNARNLRWGRKPGEGSGHPRLRWLYRRPLKRRGPMWASAPTKTSYQLPRAAATPRSGALGAAFEEASVAVTAIRFYWPARSSDGVPGDDAHRPIGLNSFRVATPGDARRAAPWGPGAAAPGAFWGPSPRGKVPRRRPGEGPRHAGRSPADEAADAARTARWGASAGTPLRRASRATSPQGEAWAGAVGENVQAAQACV